ncbi:MAG TPA: hypothetical protein VF857_09090, partial [Spirochaetota bacterium]
MNTTGSVGLALTKASTSSVGKLFKSASTEAGSEKSNLKTVDSTGKMSDAFSSGTATVSKFMIAPNNKIYLLFSQKTDLATSKYSVNGCLLAEVDPNTGTPTAVDTTLISIQWNTNVYSYQNKPIQFDNTGAIYYLGMDSTGKYVLRKFLNGTSTDLINDNIQIYDFLVNGDGSVFISGTTQTTGAMWCRRISPTGSLGNIVTINTEFMACFPDNNVYMGLGSNTYNGVYRFLSATTNTLESKPWISSTSMSPYNDVTSTPLDAGGTNGANISDLVQTIGGKVYASANTGSGSNRVMQYYPTLATPTISVVSVSV